MRASAGTVSPVTTTSLSVPSTFTVPAVSVCAVSDELPGSSGMTIAGVVDVEIAVFVASGGVFGGAEVGW